MALHVQLDLFEEQTEELFLQKEIGALIKAQDNLRRGLFARHNELAKAYVKQQEEIEALKRQFLIFQRNK